MAGIQVNTVIDPGTSTIAAKIPEETAVTALASSTFTEYTFEHPTEEASLIEAPTAQLANTGLENIAKVQVNITRCNTEQPVIGAEVYFTASQPGDNLPPTFLASETGTGFYEASIPLGNAPLSGKIVEQACSGITNVLSVSCESSSALRQSGAGVFCGALSTTIDAALVGPTGEGAVIFSECVSGFLAFEAYCSTLGVTSTGIPGPTDTLCKSIANAVDSHPGIQSAIDMNQLKVQAYVNIPGHTTKTSTAVTANPFTENYPVFSVDFGGIIDIVDISASPASPRKGQAYSVTSTLACSAGSTVTIEVNGSDRFVSSQTFSPVDDTPLTVQVPASTGKRDIIKVLAISPETGPFGFVTASRDIAVELLEENSTTPSDTFNFSAVTKASFTVFLDRLCVTVLITLI